MTQPCVLNVNATLTREEVLIWLYLNACYTNDNANEMVILRKDSYGSSLWLVVPNTPGEHYVGKHVSETFLAHIFSQAVASLSGHTYIDYFKDVAIKVDFSTLPTIDLTHYRSHHPYCKNLTMDVASIVFC